MRRSITASYLSDATIKFTLHGSAETFDKHLQPLISHFEAKQSIPLDKIKVELNVDDCGFLRKHAHPEDCEYVGIISVCKSGQMCADVKMCMETRICNMVLLLVHFVELNLPIKNTYEAVQASSWSG